MTGRVPTDRLASTTRPGHTSRLIRSTVFAGVMVALAGLAHAVAGGMAPAIGLSASAVLVLGRAEPSMHRPGAVVARRTRGDRWLVLLILLSDERTRTRTPLCRVLARLLGRMPDAGIAHHLPAGGAAAGPDADLPRVLVPQRGAEGRRGPPVGLVTPCKLP